MFAVGTPWLSISSNSSFRSCNADDNHGSFWWGGARKEWGYHALLVACGASNVKSFTSKCDQSDKISSAPAPLPCNMIKTLLVAFNGFPAVTMFFLCMIIYLRQKILRSFSIEFEARAEQLQFACALFHIALAIITIISFYSLLRMPPMEKNYGKLTVPPEVRYSWKI